MQNAFENIENALDECFLLWFMDNESLFSYKPMYLTIALCLLIPNPDDSSKEVPIGFI